MMVAVAVATLSLSLSHCRETPRRYRRIPIGVSAGDFPFFLFFFLLLLVRELRILPSVYSRVRYAREVHFRRRR